MNDQRRTLPCIVEMSYLAPFISRDTSKYLMFYRLWPNRPAEEFTQQESHCKSLTRSTKQQQNRASEQSSNYFEQRANMDAERRTEYN